MVGILLKQLDLLLDARDSGRVAHECRSRTDLGAFGNGHQQLAKLRSRLTGLTIEPPTRVHERVSPSTNYGHCARIRRPGGENLRRSAAAHERDDRTADEAAVTT